MDTTRICKNLDCNNYVPKYYVDNNGKKHCCYKRKYCFKCSPFGEHNTRQLENSFGRKIKVCPSCEKEHNQKAHKCFSCYFKERQARKIEDVKKMVGDSCWICKYNKTWKNLCFHHIDPEDKLFGLSTRELVGTKWSKVIKEMKKCILVCYNCHGEIHDNLINQEKIIKIWNKHWGL